MGEEVIFISKKLADIAKHIEGLSELEKRYIIERAEAISPESLVELYNILGEYGKLE